MKAIIIELLAFVLSVVLIAFGIAKLSNIADFEMSLHAQGASKTVGILVVIFVPWAEVIAGVSVMLRLWRVSGMILSAFLWLSFAGWHAYRFAANIIVPCHCAGNVQIPLINPILLITSCLIAFVFCVGVARSWNSTHA